MSGSVPDRVPMRVDVSDQTCSVGRFRYKRRSGSGQPDDAVVETLPAVDDAGLPRVRVGVQVEVVSDQFHLVEGLVDRHGFGWVFLLARDVAGPVGLVVVPPLLFGYVRQIVTCV